MGIPYAAFFIGIVVFALDDRWLHGLRMHVVEDLTEIAPSVFIAGVLPDLPPHGGSGSLSPHLTIDSRPSDALPML
jgi:hypothetical protein